MTKFHQKGKHHGKKLFAPSSQKNKSRCQRSLAFAPPGRSSVWRTQTIVLVDGTHLSGIDFIILCTRYRYYLPFLPSYQAGLAQRWWSGQASSLTASNYTICTRTSFSSRTRHLLFSVSRRRLLPSPFSTCSRSPLRPYFPAGSASRVGGRCGTSTSRERGNTERE